MKYKPIKSIQANNDKDPNMMLTGYSMGYLEILASNATLDNKLPKHTIPSAPSADMPRAITEADIKQYALTALEKIRKNNALMIKAIPNTVKKIFKLLWKVDV